MKNELSVRIRRISELESENDKLKIELQTRIRKITDLGEKSF